MRLPDDLDGAGDDLTVEELAALLDRSVRTIYRWIHEGRFPDAYNLGTWRIPQQTVLNYISSRTIPTESTPSPE